VSLKYLESEETGPEIMFLGVFFEMFSSDMRKSPPATFADLKERNYTLIIPNEPMILELVQNVLDDRET
jgi:hypothetical protein